MPGYLQLDDSKYVNMAGDNQGYENMDKFMINLINQGSMIEITREGDELPKCEDYGRQYLNMRGDGNDTSNEQEQ